MSEKHAHIPTPEPPQPTPDPPPKPPGPPNDPMPIEDPARPKDNPPVSDPPPDEKPNPPRYLAASGPIIFPGLTHWSYCSAVTYFKDSAASRRPVPSL